VSWHDLSDAERRRLHDRLARLLSRGDGIAILADREGLCMYGRGLGVSGCQLELLLDELARLVRLSGAPVGPNQSVPQTSQSPPTADVSSGAP
jgi:hypothetical protein